MWSLTVECVRQAGFALSTGRAHQSISSELRCGNIFYCKRTHSVVSAHVARAATSKCTRTCMILYVYVYMFDTICVHVYMCVYI